MRTGRERERMRGQDRRRRGGRKYGRARMKHARKGILSCMIAGAAAAIFLLLIVCAYLSKGRSAAIIGSFGIMAEILAWIGFAFGVRGLRERDKNYLTCRIGILIDCIIGISLTAMFIRGIV